MSDLRRSVIGTLVLALAALVVSPQAAQAQRVRAGVLNCDVSGGIGLIIGSQRTVNCLFTPDIPGPQEGYFGTITKFGLDLGATVAGSLVWAVYADTTRGLGFLAGDYAGASGEPRWRSASAPMSWSAARTGPSRCSRCPFRGRSGSILRLGSPTSVCARRADTCPRGGHKGRPYDFAATFS